MYLSDVEVKNFRNLRDVTVSFRAGLNAIVGRNGTGKTNLLMAIRHALGSSGATSEAAHLTDDDFYRDAERKRCTEPIEITLKFSGLSEAQLVQFFEILDYNAKQPVDSKAIVRFEAEWDRVKDRAFIRRWGGAGGHESNQIPSELLAALPIVFLPALRDAEQALMPGYRNRIAKLIERLPGAEEDGAHREGVLEIFKVANESLKSHQLIVDAQDKLKQTTKGMAGSDFRDLSLRAAPVEFTRVLRQLQVDITANRLEDLAAGGLGYNNLLYIATVLAHLQETPKDEVPLLLIEEPEAHLHPQLTLQLGAYFAEQLRSESPPQVIVTTHSPTLAASLKPSQVVISTVGPADSTRFNALASLGLTEIEERQLWRLVDVTRASLYFCKKLILVEGLSEELVLPAFAKRAGRDLRSDQVSVIPLGGVSFGTLAKVLGPNGLGVPTAILTDADPKVTGEGWEDAEPTVVDGKFMTSDRAKSVIIYFADHPNVRVFLSDVTLEWDVAAAGTDNPELITKEWEASFIGTPRTLNLSRLNGANTHEEKVKVVWRGICRAAHGGSKAELAQRIAEMISTKADIKEGKELKVPGYVSSALGFIYSDAAPIETADAAEVAANG